MDSLMLLDLMIVVFLGLVLGSFASAMTWRIPRDISWVNARSACTSCKKNLFIQDLIPIFSWVLLSGRCRQCGAAIGWRYPAIEFSTLVLCLCVYFVFGLTFAGFVVMAAMPFFVAMIAIDLEHYILPDQLNLITGILGIVFVAITHPAILHQHFIIAFISAAFAWGLGKAIGVILKKDALGFGDVKFFAVAGMWLGLHLMPVFVILSGVFGIILGILWRLVYKSAIFPFGPALIFALLSLILWADPLIQGYERFWVEIFSFPRGYDY